MVSALFLVILIVFNAISDQSVVITVFKVAAYTYGPLPALFVMGMLSRIKVRDRLTPYIAFISIAVTICIDSYSTKWFGGYKFGFEILLVNIMLSCLGLWICSFFRKKTTL